ncbi:hypothetical protein EVAR_68874_1 [Eumeta japonica]|uniref:Uncharacterized protein n=1 Tax=Eumeta variegata TaxID=151549 RepID=A0A4C2AE55_EUMVA|nr:hypothetical protein EVAR_68874_1 [Eumeta japonica]
MSGCNLLAVGTMDEIMKVLKPGKAAGCDRVSSDILRRVGAKRQTSSLVNGVLILLYTFLNSGQRQLKRFMALLLRSARPRLPAPAAPSPARDG